ncbi:MULTISPECIES: hypothetical protein [unclassified Bradyrhizobium]|uniref:hypothetical protein n=1 Tax=unclassified Bradyrhizobium TaxID=2631580 RepID=UPI001BA76B6F|nr:MULTISPECIES: hypothetical protein [unclassified Bradyrhizobium]MBR1226385.1 hypothetical protein [Bradyrhizobium sp. AUGA SZCCT0176]MBR1295202.1 hypothetical protein [Bradyrhizobium sp. AUGA SZCCT0042]
MLEIAVGMIALLAGALLGGAVAVTARRRYRRDGDVKKLLVSLVAAIVALVTALLTHFVVLINIYLPTGGFSGVTGGRVLLVYCSSLLSVPVGLAWGWVLSFVGSPADATGQERASGLVVRGLAFSLFATTALAIVALAARLAGHGHDNTIGPPGIAAAFVFLGLMMLWAVGITTNFRNMSAGRAVQRVGAGFASSVMLALGIFIAAVAVESLFPGLTRLVEAWNVLIFFYPFYLGGSFALAAVLFFFGGRIFARTWSRLSLAW